ncbi:MAG: prepilin-type N-terminal cleavage/methylation domain-containing protein, partial [Magnetococcales bacterium]|nr:prepilin-type N-terminal cleavage/methylation domain-containing protein [Magnetococcales bacterium]
MIKPSLGFTLLEALIALAIAAFFMTGLYHVVNGTVTQVQALDKRAESIHLWIHLRRLLNRDLQHLDREPPARIIREGRETLILRCSGEIIPNWKLGSKVNVIYQWKQKENNEGMIWERLVQSIHGKREEAMVTLRIDQGLDKLEYALLDAQEEWHSFDDPSPPPWKAIRWRFDWHEIGAWTLIHN